MERFSSPPAMQQETEIYQPGTPATQKVGYLDHGMNEISEVSEQVNTQQQVLPDAAETGKHDLGRYPHLDATGSKACLESFYALNSRFKILCRLLTRTSYGNQHPTVIQTSVAAFAELRAIIRLDLAYNNRHAMLLPFSIRLIPDEMARYKQSYSDKDV
jgi:hypothetical protein